MTAERERRRRRCITVQGTRTAAKCLRRGTTDCHAFTPSRLHAEANSPPSTHRPPNLHLFQLLLQTFRLAASQRHPYPPTTTTTTRRSIRFQSRPRAARDRLFLANYRSTGTRLPQPRRDRCVFQLAPSMPPQRTELPLSTPI